MTDVSDLIGEHEQQELSPREALFVAEYMVDFCQWKALMRADGGEPDDKAWRELSSVIMKRPHVRAAVQRAVDERAKRLNASADDVLREISRLALFDPAHITGVDGPDDIVNLPEDVRRAIVGWSWDKRGNFIVKMAKEAMLQLLAQHHGLIKQKVEHSGPNGGAIPVAALDVSQLPTETLQQIMQAMDAARAS